VATALRTFPGVAHRLEEVAERDGVLYVNDSKATNVASTLVALASFPPATVHVILGGRGKGGGYDALAPAVAERCRAVYLVGEAADEIATALAHAGVPLERSGDLERAVAGARARAVPGEVVLLSPACTSFDQYRNFEQRGDHFRILARGA
jgi:UDP-N-acetylmuramoylalanine--D-glutamate ligase